MRQVFFVSLKGRFAYGVRNSIGRILFPAFKPPIPLPYAQFRTNMLPVAFHIESRGLIALQGTCTI